MSTAANTQGDACGHTASSFSIITSEESGRDAPGTADGRPFRPQQDEVAVSAMQRDNIPNSPPAPFNYDSATGEEQNDAPRSSVSFLRRRLALAANVRRQGPTSHHGNFRDAIDPRSILTKTMLEPPPTYNNGYGTEYIARGAEVKLGILPSVSARPASWPEPFVAGTTAVTLKTGTPELIDYEFILPTTWVFVSNDATFVDQPELSHLGASMVQSSQTAITDRTLQASATWQTPRFPDYGSLTYLMSSYLNCKGTMSQDAAPLLRCGLMMMAFACEEAMLMMTSVSQAYDFGNTPVNKCTHFLQDVMLCNQSKLYIPPDKGTCNIHFMTLKSYVDVISDSRVCDHFDTTLDQKLLRRAVIVPVKLEDMQSDHLIPYVASFTTTYWWNGASYYDMIRSDGFGAKQVRYRGSTRAGMTAVPGNYKEVVCVVMDAGPGDVRGATFGSWVSSDDSRFCAEGAKEIYSWLGMYSGSSWPSRDTMMTAYHRICGMVGTTDVRARVEFMLAELSFTLPMGYTVRTEKTSDSKSWYGPRSSGGQMKIAKKDVPLATTVDDIASCAEVNRNWAVSPLGLFIMSSATYECRNRSEDNNRYEEFRLLKNPTYQFNQYTVTENVAMVRLLVAADAFVDALSCEDSAKAVNADYWPIEIQYKAAFMSLVSGWWYLESGLPITDFNGLSETKWRSVQSYREVLRATTCGFVNPAASSRRLIDDKDKWQSRIKKALGMDEWQLGFENIWSLHVPFWAVKSVMEKLGYRAPCVFKPGHSMYMRSGSWFDAYGHKVENDTDNGVAWYKLAALSSTLNYEVKDTQQDKFFDILVLNNSRTSVGATLTGWFPHCRIDQNKMKNGHSDSYYEDSEEGVIELLAIVNPYHRAVLDIQPPQMYVDDRNRTSSRFSADEDPITVELVQPDPFADWLYSGLLKIAPHVVVGDIPGAIFAGAEHVVSSVLDWVKNRFRIQQREPWAK